jgi:hypothetical protein
MSDSAWQIGGKWFTRKERVGEMVVAILGFQGGSPHLC